MASPGFLTNGVSRELLEKWAPDPRNGVIITGYSVEGVMARVSFSFTKYASYRRAYFEELDPDDHERTARYSSFERWCKNPSSIVSLA